MAKYCWWCVAAINDITKHLYNVHKWKKEVAYDLDLSIQEKQEFEQVMDDALKLLKQKLHQFKTTSPWWFVYVAHLSWWGRTLGGGWEVAL